MRLMYSGRDFAWITSGRTKSVSRRPRPRACALRRCASARRLRLCAQTHNPERSPGRSRPGAGRQGRRRQDHEAGGEAAEINRELAALRRAFNLAVQAGRLINRPHFPMLKERNTRRGFLDADQIDRICAALEATDTAKDANVSGLASWQTSFGLRLRRAGGRPRRCCRSNGGTSIGKGAAFDWTRTRRRTTKAARSRLRPTSRTILTEQLAIARKAQGRRHDLSVRVPSERRAHRLLPIGVAERLQGRRLSRGLVHDMRRSAVRRSSAPECHGRSPCRSSATRPSRSIAATRSSTKRCSEKRRRGSMPGRGHRYRHCPEWSSPYDADEGCRAIRARRESVMDHC